MEESRARERTECESTGEILGAEEHNWNCFKEMQERGWENQPKLNGSSNALEKPFT